MADLSSFPEQKGEISRSTTQTSPTHYTVQIQAFSSLAKNNIERYETADFESGGYKWKLVLYPSGNKNKNVKDHLSFYIVIAEASSLLPGWEVHAIFRLFLLDQNKDEYLTIEETTEKGRRFHAMKLEWGFDEFIPLKTFNDPSSGYLVDDTCVFGAEVFVSHEKNKGKGECLSMIKDAVSYKHTWRIVSFSGLTAECEDSKTFTIGDQKWKIQMYSKGKGSGTGSHISLYLALADPTALPQGSKIYVEFTLRILDQIQNRHYSGKANYWYSSSNQFCGWPRFISLSYFSQSNSGFLVKDNCWVDAEVTVHGMSRPF